MNRCKNYSKVLIFLMLSLCLFMRCIEGGKTRNDDCSDDNKPYKQTFEPQECIAKEECKQSDTNKNIYLTAADYFVCANSEKYCQSEINNSPSYHRIFQTDFTECIKCPEDKPYITSNVCGQCPDKKIFTYVPIAGQTEPCVTLDQIKTENDITGIFDAEFKIYYQSGYVCPQNQSQQMVFFNTSGKVQAFNKCEWCPLDKPVTQDGTCIACTGGQITDEETHSCIDANKCKNILSMDGKICYESKCPFGYIINKNNDLQWTCDICNDNKYPSVDQAQCVSSCGVNEALHEASNSCIPSESCDGFYSDQDTAKSFCQKESCQRIFASFILPASIVLEKADGKTYQVCETCPSGKEFVYVDGQDPINKCLNCAVDNQGTISDFMAGICIALDKIGLYGILNEEKTILFPEGKYNCKQGYYLTDASNSKTEYRACTKCPQHQPISDGVTCSNSCPDDFIADYYFEECKPKQDHICSGKYSVDQLLCSPVCKQGEKINDQGKCETCPTNQPNSSSDFSSCLFNSDCFLDFETGICFESSADCAKKGKNYFYQKDTQTCKKGCGNDEIKSTKNNLPYCKGSCEEDEFIVLEAKICLKKTECSKFISGTPSQCLETCKEGEVIIEKPDGQSYTECVVANQCKTALVEQPDKSFVCTKNCKTFVNAEDKKCIDACPTDFYQDNEQTNSNYYICYKTCPQGKLSFTSPADGKKYCIQESVCQFYISSDKTSCTVDCLTNEVATQNGDTRTCEKEGYTCGYTYSYKYKDYKMCSDKCNHFMLSTGEICIEKCPDDEKYALEKKGTETFQKCAQTCQNYFFLNESGNLQCSSTCTAYLDIDNKQCLKDCNSSHYILEKKENETYQQCSVECAKIKIVDDKGIKYCVSDCSEYLYTETQTCVGSCQVTDFTYDKVESETYTKCSNTCEFNPYTDEKGIKRCTKTCTSYLAVNGKDCNQSCQGNEYTKDKESGEIFFRCSDTCDSFEYYTEDNIKRCGKTCPKKQITYKNDIQNKCLKNKKECPAIMSSKGDECTSKCLSEKYEYAKTMNGFNQCTPCKGYYKSEDQTCSQTCSADQIRFPDTHECIDKTEGEIKCKNIQNKLSVDKTLCTGLCQIPEVTTTSGECKAPCDPKDTDCTDCKTGEYLVIVGSSQYCYPDNCGIQYLSSDKKTCVNDCALIGENFSGDGRTCSQCKENEIVVFQPPFSFICKNIEDPNISQDKLNTIKYAVERSKISQYEIEGVKSKVSGFAKETFKQLSESKELSPQELLMQVINLSKSFVSSISNEQFAYAPYKIGTKDDILIQAQKIETGFRYKKNLDFEQILNGSNYSLTEENLDEEQETITVLATTILASNPVCKIDACKTYPVFSLDKTESVGRRILQTSQDFTVTFNVKDSTDIKKYICLSYDLSNPTADPTKVQTTIGHDNQSITCLVSGSVSILLDSTCIYIDKSLCPKKPDDSNNNNNNNNGQNTNESESDDDELNGGEIAGIVIGVIAFVGVSALIILQIIKQNKIKGSKKYQQPQDNVKHEQFHTEVAINTLGVNPTDKQV